MTAAVELFNNLDGKVVTREALEDIAILAQEQEQQIISNKIYCLLKKETAPEFRITIAKREMERVPKDFLYCLDEDCPDEEPNLEDRIHWTVGNDQI